MTQKQRSAAEKRARAKFKREYLEYHKSCVVRWGDYCTQRAEDVHELLPFSAGGKRELGNVAAVCRACHSLIHSNPTKSKKLGWLRTITRLDRGRVS